MSKIEDELDEETVEKLEEAKLESKRSKTKYGNQITDE